MTGKVRGRNESVEVGIKRVNVGNKRVEVWNEKLSDVV